MSDSDLEKTEQATPKRIQQAREEGNVPRSRELSIFAILVFGFSGFWMLSGWFLSKADALVIKGLKLNKYITNDSSLLLDHLGEMFVDGLILISPIFVILIIASFISPLALRSIIFSTKALMPKFSRLDPIEGIKRLFSLMSLMELAKAILKTMLLGGIGLFLLWKYKNEMLGLNSEDVYRAIGHSGDLVIWSIMIVIGSLIVVVVIDVPFQIWNYYDKLKMTIEEIKKEMKEMEGNPHVKSRRRAIASQLSRGQMISAVPGSDVIVTNPTHYAIALSYKEGMSAPKVVAMGVDNMALKIREVAKENKIAIVEAPPLARALYKYTDVDQEIPQQFYQSVAEVIGYMYQLKKWEKSGGQYPMPPETFFTGKFDLEK
jgi:flagellar biosynthesis protein FlhB